MTQRPDRGTTERRDELRSEVDVRNPADAVGTELERHGDQPAPRATASSTAVPCGPS